MNMVSIQEQIVVITGASSGIGASCAKMFAKEGASLILAARRRDKLEQVATEIKQTYQSQIYLLEMDVSDRHGVATSLTSLPESWRNIDILVNNAGVYGPKGTIETVDWQEWCHAIEINLYGVVLMTRALLPHFAGLSALTFVIYAYMAWIPTFFARTYGLRPADITVVYGATTAVCGAIGLLLGGAMADRQFSRGVLDGHLRIIA